MTTLNTRRSTETDHKAGLAIAHELVESAIWHGNLCIFQGAVPPDELDLPPLYATMGGDAYDGTSGIARFLALTAQFDDDPLLIKTARGAMRHAMSHTHGTSLFSGMAGTAVIALETGWREFHLAARDMLDTAATMALDATDPPADLLAGHAGLILGLGAIARTDSRGPWAGYAMALGHQLVAMGRAECVGMSWPVMPGHNDHLCGLAHGAAGIAQAMEVLVRLAPEAGPWRDTARRARAFERAWYSPEHGSWADLRSDAMGSDGEVGYPHMWCHGSIGIAADRLTADPRDILSRADRVAALEGVMASTRDALAIPRGPGGSDAINGSQCHGLSGVADLLIDAWRMSKRSMWLDLARACTAAIRDDARRPEGWRSGVPGGHPTPGLMLGLSGIGWGQLRAAHPEIVPSAWRIGSLL
jgi:lantibiotic modifying enzyme